LTICFYFHLQVDAFGEEATFDFGTDHRAKLETRLRFLEDGNLKRLSGTGKAKAKFEKYQSKSEVRQYPTKEDSTLPTPVPKKRKHSEAGEVKPKILIEEIKQESDEAEASTSKTPKSDKKKKNKNKSGLEEDVTASPMKKVKMEDQSGDENQPGPSSEQKKKKKKEKKAVEEPEEAEMPEEPVSEKKKKKKKKVNTEEDD
jgi:nucleolar protein 58